MENIWNKSGWACQNHIKASLENIILIFRDVFIWEYKKNLKKCKILKKKFDYLGKWGRIIVESDKDIIVLDIKKVCATCLFILLSKAEIFLLT